MINQRTAQFQITPVDNGVERLFLTIQTSSLTASDGSNTTSISKTFDLVYPQTIINLFDSSNLNTADTDFDVGTAVDLSLEVSKPIDADLSNTSLVSSNGTFGPLSITDVLGKHYYNFNFTPTLAGNGDQWIKILQAKDWDNFVYNLTKSGLSFKNIVSFMEQYGANVHFDSSITSSVIIADSKVMNWIDQINGLSFIQDVLTQMPTTGTQNGLNSVVFDGPSNQKLSIDGVASSIPFGTYIIVYNNTSTASYSSPLFGVGHYISHGGLGDTLYEGKTNTGGGAYTYVNKVEIGTPASPLNSIPRTANVGSICVVSQKMTSIQSTNLFMIGASTYASINGSICEIVLFPTILADADRIAVENHLIAKWGL